MVVVEAQGEFCCAGLGTDIDRVLVKPVHI